MKLWPLEACVKQTQLADLSVFWNRYTFKTSCPIDRIWAATQRHCVPFQRILYAYPTISVRMRKLRKEFLQTWNELSLEIVWDMSFLFFNLFLQRWAIHVRENVTPPKVCPRMLTYSIPEVETFQERYATFGHSWKLGKVSWWAQKKKDF